MFKVLIVDDEEIICKGIKSQINRIQNPYIQEVLMAHCGMEALLLANEAKPDIIITDIIMPDMSGIELIRQVSEGNRNVQFIMLSGHDDYNYVRESFKLGAMDYLLKPAGIEELKERLESAANKLLEQKRRDDANGGESPTDKFTYLLEKKMNQLISSGLVSEINAEEMFRDISSYFPYNSYSLGIVRFDRLILPASEKESIVAFFKEKSMVFQKNRNICISAIFDYQDRLLLMMNYAEDSQYHKMILFLKEFVNELMNMGKHSVSASISLNGTRLSAMNLLYKQAAKALSYRIILDSAVIDYGTIKDRNIEFPISTKDLDAFLNVYRTRPMDELGEWIDLWYSRDKWRNQTIDNVWRLYDWILNHTRDLLRGRQIATYEIQARDFFSFHTLDELKLYLKDTIYQAKRQYVEMENREKTVIDIAQRYIEDNYTKDINMAEVANLVSMNYSYFSKLFKGQSGMTFSAYLLKVRMEQSRDLLKDPRNRINEIASKVGYDNMYHFSRAFKNYYGVSPKIMRDHSFDGE